MAKVGTLQQGYVGKLDGQAYYKGADGKTVVRKITIPKNPKTLGQRVQRVITKTVGDNYRVMKAICDHSFEGKSMGYQCANRFRSLNAIRMRERAAYLQEQGLSLYEYYNFQPIGATQFRPAAVFVSEGTLKQVYASISGIAGLVPASANTYQAVIEALGAQRGDQMTFVTVEKDLENNFSFNFARVILDPRNENGAAELSVPFITEGAIGNPNSRNKGSFAALAFDNGISFRLTSGTVVAVGIIMSRKADNKWLRSTCQLALSETNMAGFLTSLMAAAESDGSAVLDVESEQFLNNAGTGGSEGSSQSAPSTDPSTPGTGEAALGNTCNINGAAQSIAGGSTNVNPLNSFAFNGTNLSGSTFKATKNNGSDIAPTTQTATVVSWSFSDSANGDVYRFYMDGTLKFTVNVVASGGEEEGGM